MGHMGLASALQRVEGCEMGLFGRKAGAKNRCPDCRFYAMVQGHGYCAKSVPATVNIRLLSQEAIKRQCVPCPEQMTCEDFQAR